MTVLPPGASDGEILEILRYWLDQLAAEKYEEIYAALGYALAYQEDVPGPRRIEHEIKRYRSPLSYPGIDTFRVTDWRTATEGRHGPDFQVIRYARNSTGLGGAASINLPLNGTWSDLRADFVWSDGTCTNGAQWLSLEEISSHEQFNRELEERERDR